MLQAGKEKFSPATWAWFVTHFMLRGLKGLLFPLYHPVIYPASKLVTVGCGQGSSEWLNLPPSHPLWGFWLQQVI